MRAPRLLGAGDIGTLDFGKAAGLLPAIVQDIDTGAVLMLGYQDDAALRATFERGRVVFFSRARRQLWQKGETSGHYFHFIEARCDCDRDALLLLVRPNGPACHEGTLTCFADAPLPAPHPLAFLQQLESIIAQRIETAAPDSYSARLYAQGIKRMAQKVGEEGLEVALAAVADSDDALIGEASDLLFHLLLLLKSRGLSLEGVTRSLAARHVR